MWDGKESNYSQSSRTFPSTKIEYLLNPVLLIHLQTSVGQVRWHKFLSPYPNTTVNTRNSATVILPIRTVGLVVVKAKLFIDPSDPELMSDEKDRHRGA